MLVSDFHWDIAALLDPLVLPCTPADEKHMDLVSLVAGTDGNLHYIQRKWLQGVA